MNDSEEIKDILRELLKWTKFQGMQKVKEVLESVLDNDSKKMVYELSDGRSSSNISETVELSDQSVRNYWKDWSRLGIMEVHPEYKRRYRRVFSLKEVGIEVPQIAQSVTIEKDTEKAN